MSLNTIEPIDEMLEILGETIYIGLNHLLPILALPSMSARELNSYNSPYDNISQVFTLSTSIKVYQDNATSLAIGQTVKYNAYNYSYIFEITDFLDDLTGWVLIQLNLLSKTDV